MLFQSFSRGFTLVALLAVIASAQQKSSSASNAGVVSGSVFAVTQGGDLKPARMANVYLFYVFRSVKWANAHPEDEDSAGSAWLDNSTKGLEEMTKEEAAMDERAWNKNWHCHRELLAYSNALLDTRKWASANGKEWQILTTTVDENGVFKVRVPRPGRYIIVASGHAGFNDAFWDAPGSADEIDVASGTTMTVKLSSPQVACLVRSED